MTIGVGVIGLGYWGPNLVRNFADVAGARLVGISDVNGDRLGAVAARYPGIGAWRDYRDLIAAPGIDAVVIATPVSTHHMIALAALRAGKHVLVEKPLAASADQGLSLIDEAARRGRILMVDHTFVYTPAVEKIAALVSSGELGEMYYYDSVRVNLGLFQHDVNVLWDLAVHDLAIIDRVIGLQPRAVSATGMSHISQEPENIAYMTLFFDTRLIAHVHVNWLAPVKIRRTLIGGSQKMIVYDDVEASDKVKVYDKGVTVRNDPDRLYQMLLGYRAGDMWAPRLGPTEPLRTEVEHFLRCIETGETPITDGHSGLRVVRVVEAASVSMEASGRLIELDASTGAMRV